MAVRFTYDATLRILFTTAEGLVSLADIERHLAEEAEARAIGYRELIDASAAWTDLTSAQLTCLAERLHSMMQSGPFGSTALVTTNDLVFGMASMLAILLQVRGGPSLGAFRSFDEGLDWLVRTGTEG